MQIPSRSRRQSFHPVARELEGCTQVRKNFIARGKHLLKTHRPPLWGNDYVLTRDIIAAPSRGAIKSTVCATSFTSIPLKIRRGCKRRAAPQRGGVTRFDSDEKKTARARKSPVDRPLLGRPPFQNRIQSKIHVKSGISIEDRAAAIT